jgi:hypothetical protein
MVIPSYFIAAFYFRTKHRQCTEMNLTITARIFYSNRRKDVVQHPSGDGLLFYSVLPV